MKVSPEDLLNEERQMSQYNFGSDDVKNYIAAAITENGTNDPLTTSLIQYYVIVNLSEGPQLPAEGLQTSPSFY